MNDMICGLLCFFSLIYLSKVLWLLDQTDVSRVLTHCCTSEVTHYLKKVMRNKSRFLPWNVHYRLFIHKSVLLIYLLVYRLSLVLSSRSLIIFSVVFYNILNNNLITISSIRQFLKFSNDNFPNFYLTNISTDRTTDCELI